MIMHNFTHGGRGSYDLAGIDLNLAFGWMHIETTKRKENGKIIMGYIATRYDRHGNVVSRKVGDTMTVFFADGNTITRQDALSMGVKI